MAARESGASGVVAAQPADEVVFDPRARSRGLLSTAFWAIVCLLAFTWWASRYSSLVEWLGEWQFTHLGEYYPSLTVVLCVALLATPVLAIVLLRRRERRRRAERVAPIVGAERAEIAINAAERGRIFFLAVTGVALLCALWALLSLLSLPPSEGPLVTIDRANAETVRPGPARFAATRSLGPVALLRENVGFVQRVMYVAPVTLGSDTSGSVRFFTEVDRLAAPTPRFSSIRKGVLEANGLPGELINLYRGAGVQAADRPYLLVADAARLRWRPLVLAAQLALLAIVAAIAALLLRRQARRLRRRIDRAERT